MIARVNMATIKSVARRCWQAAVAFSSWKFASPVAFGAGFLAGIVAKGSVDRVALLGAVANAVIAVAAVMSFRATVRQARETLQLTTLRDLDGQWLQLRSTREAAALALQENRPDDREVDHLLDFFETIAACVEDGRVSNTQARDAFGWYASHYWRASSQYRKFVSERSGSKIWDCFHRVAGGWAQPDKNPHPEEETKRFLLDESASERDQREFKGWLDASMSAG